MPSLYERCGDPHARADGIKIRYKIVCVFACVFVRFSFRFLFFSCIFFYIFLCRFFYINIFILFSV